MITRLIAVALGLCVVRAALGQQVVEPDWLIDGKAFRANVEIEAGGKGVILSNGLIRRVIKIGPNAGTTAIDLIAADRSLLRSTRPEAEIVVEGRRIPVGGLAVAGPANFLDREREEEAKGWPGALLFREMRQGAIEARFPWKPRKEWLSRPMEWPPKGVRVDLVFRGADENEGLEVVVHHECYDGVPLLGKWLTVVNRSDRALEIDGFKSEILAVVEAESTVEEDTGQAIPDIHVETDATLCSGTAAGAQVKTVHWVEDPTYTTQVNYRLKTPCLLEVRPFLGPHRLLAAGESFESMRTWLMPFDSQEATRRTLALGRFYRTLAPWAFENPLIFHARSAASDAVRAAIEQAAEVGFELVILTFGSGFDIEERGARFLDEMKALVDFAHAKGVGLGGYSLFASRSISPDVDVIDPATGKPGGARFGASPCIGSEWGRNYFTALREFFERTGADVLEHDGSYPGDVCASTTHPGHRGLEDSYWNQRSTIVDFYRWCRGRGVYLNVPDWYFMNGSSKTGMGYRETNWSLPREDQEIIERQNIADGTRRKTPTMGWMFVPLTEYHGGGPRATIEPLDMHIDHYGRRFDNLLGAGVQACFRGPRLFDSERTKAMVKAKVAFFKAHRRILESDLLILRRADGRDYDGWIHVDPEGEEKACAFLYNPLREPIRRRIRLPLRYAGLRERAVLSIADGSAKTVAVDASGHAIIDVELAAQGAVVVVVR